MRIGLYYFYSIQLIAELPGVKFACNSYTAVGIYNLYTAFFSNISCLSDLWI